MKLIPLKSEYSRRGHETNIEMTVRVEDISQGFRFQPIEVSEYQFPPKAIVKCQHCHQWAARYTACVHCGAPVD